MKKTLLIDSRSGGDFSLDLIFAGLVRRLGPENVIDFPAHMKHRIGKPRLVGDHERDYGAERASLSYTDRNDEVVARSLVEINGMLRRGEIERIFIDERDESYELYLSTAARFFGVPVVVIAGHDRFWNISPDHVAKRYPTLERMFIDDWQKEYDLLSYARLINLSINFDHLWDSAKRESLLQNKVYDICFMGYNSTGERAKALDHLVARYSHLNNWIVLEKRGNKFDSFVRHDEYFSKMAQSKICINVPGASTSGRALRYYEIPYVGSCMVSQVFPAKLLYPFENGVHCSYFSNLDELERSVDTLLFHGGHREVMAKSAREYAIKYHTIDSRMDYVFSTLGS